MAYLRIGLYHLAVQNNPARTVSDVLAFVQNLPNDASRSQTLSATEDMRPRSLQRDNEVWIGEFTRIHKIDTLPLTHPSGQERVLEFGPDDPHPSEHTVFLFDPQSNVLHIDEHAGAVTHAGFARYIQAVEQLRSVSATPIIGADAMMRFARQENFSRITVSLAGMDNAEYLRSLGFNQEELLRLIDLFNAPKVKLEMSIASRKHDPEGLARVRETVGALLNLPSKQLKKLVVEGREQGGSEDFPVDLIKGRVKYIKEVELDQGRIADADRYRAVREAWERNRDELRGRFTAAPEQPQ